MKKIMIVTGSLGSGGIEKVTSRIANYYQNKQYKVYIVTLLSNSGDSFQTINNDIEIISYKKDVGNNISKKLSIFSWIKFLKKIFHEIKPNCVLAMTLKIASLCILSRRKENIRICLRETSDPKSKVRNRITDNFLFFICRKIDAIIFQTQWEKLCYPKFLQKRGLVIPNPVDVKQILSKEKTKKIVTMGRLMNIQKRHDVLIEAFSEFSKEYKDFALIIYGDGPDLEKDKELIKKFHVEDNVIIEKPKVNIHEKIADSYMFIMTSDFEGLSNALVEAMLLGIPCITSDWPGSDEIIRHGENGLIYNRNNICELVQCMKKLADDPHICKKISNNGIKESQKYQPDIVLAKYSALIEGE